MYLIPSYLSFGISYSSGAPVVAREPDVTGRSSRVKWFFEIRKYILRTPYAFIYIDISERRLARMRGRNVTFL